MLQAQYLDTEAISQLPPGADATVLLRALSDKYSSLLTPKEVAQLLKRYDPAGMNLQVDDTTGQVVVGVVPPVGSEAERSGVRMGDHVVRLGARDTRGLDVDEAECAAGDTGLASAGAGARTVVL